MEKLKPAVHKKWLIFTSGLMWSGVGILLNWFAYRWLPAFERWQVFFAYGLGTIAGVIIVKFGFGKLAVKNRNRINDYPEKVCLFAFQRWQMYILIVVMMSMGIFMRTSGLIPKYLLAPVYIGIGLALFLGSFVYYKEFFQKKELKKEN
jgi:hypothetical protein